MGLCKYVLLLAKLNSKHFGRDSSLVAPITTEEYLARNPSSALRPKNSVLDTTKAGETGYELIDWTVSFEEFLRILDGAASQ